MWLIAPKFWACWKSSFTALLFSSAAVSCSLLDCCMSWTSFQGWHFLNLNLEPKDTEMDTMLFRHERCFWDFLLPLSCVFVCLSSRREPGWGGSENSYYNYSYHNTNNGVNFYCLQSLFSFVAWKMYALK